MIRLAIIASLIGFCGQAYAEDKFPQIKARMSEQLELQVSELQKAKTCVAAAQDMASLKKCHFQRRNGLRDLKTKMQEKYKSVSPQAEQKKIETEFLDDFID